MGDAKRAQKAGAEGGGHDGYAAVLVRLPMIDVDLLTDVVTEAWRCRASKRLQAERDG
jgi:hypothetical protein